jgi:hypothetical protein
MWNWMLREARRGERAADIEGAVQIPEMMMPTITKAIRKQKQMHLICKALEGENYTPEVVQDCCNCCKRDRIPEG